MKPSLESLLHEAVNFEADAFDHDQDINGADLVQWFAEWRWRAQTIVRANRPTDSAATYGQRFRNQLIDALHALHLTQGKADAEIEELVRALDNGGIQITSGAFKVMVFKHPAKEPSCKRR